MSKYKNSTFKDQSMSPTRFAMASKTNYSKKSFISKMKKIIFIEIQKCSKIIKTKIRLFIKTKYF